jgi:hypothetical protein
MDSIDDENVMDEVANEINRVWRYDNIHATV